MARHQHRVENLLPGAQGPAVLRYKAVIAQVQELIDRGFLELLTTVTFMNPGGKDGRYRDLLGALCVDYWRKKRERLRFIWNVAPSTFDSQLWAAHLLWQHDLPDLRWIAGWLVQRSGWSEDEIAKHVIREGKPRFSGAVARDVLQGRFHGLEHPFGRIDLRVSDDASGEHGRVPATEYFAEHSMTDETLIFESTFTRKRGWQPPADKIQ